MAVNLKKWLVVDALNRAWRTVLQGIVLTALSAAGDVVLQAVQKSMFEHMPLNWTQVGETALYAFLSSVGLAILAYLHRAVLDPTNVPSAQPPAPPPGVKPPATSPPPAL